MSEVQTVRRYDGATASIAPDVLGASEPDGVTSASEAGGHIVGVGSSREISADFSYQYGHVAVALAECVTRTVIEEDIRGEQEARAQLAAELALLRHDFAEWEAGLGSRGSDAHFEATGIIADFNVLDEPHLPVILTHEPVSGVDLHSFIAYGSAGTDGQPAPEPRRGLFGWLQGLSDEQLVNYFQWSEARTDAVSVALASHREEIEQNVRGAFEHLIMAGLAPEDARDALERGFTHTTIFGALNAIESGFYQADGLYETDARRLGVHRAYGADEVEKYVYELRNVFVHEFIHAFDAANNTGLTYLLSNDEVPLAWVDEAVKEHLTEAGTSGQPLTLNPYERYIEGAYKDIRELLHLVLTAGEFKIDLRELMAANFERHDTEGTQTARENLVTRLRESYQDMFPDLSPGETILHVIARDINAAPKPLCGQVVQGWIRKMTEWRNENLMGDWPLVG